MDPIFIVRVTLFLSTLFLIIYLFPLWLALDLGPLMNGILLFPTEFVVANESPVLLGFFLNFSVIMDIFCSGTRKNNQLNSQTFKRRLGGSKNQKP